MLTLLLIMIVVVAAFVYIQPTDFRVTRGAAMNAPPIVVFGQVNDFHKWEAWSPWAKMDPAARKSYEGAPSGVGALFRWEGTSKVGKGNMIITESRPGELILIRLEFLKPFKAINTTTFTFKAEGSQTLVTWSMQGTNNFIGKAMNLVLNCDRMVGGQFEEGLANMKAIVESAKG